MNTNEWKGDDHWLTKKIYMYNHGKYSHKHAANKSYALIYVCSLGEKETLP